MKVQRPLPIGEKVKGIPIPSNNAYLCDACDRWDPEGGAAPPIVGRWFCRDHLWDALSRGGERR